MGDLGVFGGTVPEEMEGTEFNDRAAEGSRWGFKDARVRGSGGAGGAMFGANQLEKKAADGLADEEADKAAMPVPAPMAPGKADSNRAFRDAAGEGKGEGRPGSGGPLVQPTLRTKFADTALWVGNLTTESNGTAEVALDMPENLTTWRIKVWGMGHGTKVGQGQTDVITRKDLIVRLEAPRFFVQTDEVVLSAIVHNYLKTKKSVQVVMELGGKTLQPLDDLTRTVAIAPQGEARVDWRVKVLDEGQAVVRMKALTDEESDAMEQKFPCFIHGMLKMEAWSRRHSAPEHHGPVQRPRARGAAARAIAHRGPLFAHAGRGHGRRPALPGRLSLRLHGADAQPLPAHGDHAEDPAGDASEPGGDPQKADQPQRPGDRRGRRARQAVEALRPQPGLRRGRGPQDGQGRASSA